MQGVPGRSNAFEIAKRLGLSDVIVGDASKQINQDNDVNRIIEQLEEQMLNDTPGVWQFQRHCFGQELPA